MLQHGHRKLTLSCCHSSCLSEKLSVPLPTPKMFHLFSIQPCIKRKRLPTCANRECKQTNKPPKYIIITVNRTSAAWFEFEHWAEHVEGWLSYKFQTNPNKRVYFGFTGGVSFPPLKLLYGSSNRLGYFVVRKAHWRGKNNAPRCRPWNGELPKVSLKTFTTRNLEWQYLMDGVYTVIRCTPLLFGAIWGCIWPFLTCRSSNKTYDLC